jgi:hypothetical protein
MNGDLVNRLAPQLWPQGDQLTTPQVYAVLDGARAKRIVPMIRLSRLEYACLYGGRLSPALEAAAPYLVHLTRTAEFFRHLIEDGWGRSWGIITVVPPDVTIHQQRRHLRTLLRVQDPDGRVLVFRFYDPRVLRTFLPTCSGDQAREVFGPIPTLAAESDDGDALIAYTRRADGVAAHLVALTGHGEPLAGTVAPG